MATRTTLDALNAAIVACRRCPRLVAYREAVARRRKPQFATWEYWGRPVPGVGDARARILLVGLAPAAHGANRTGRMFTGDGSGDFLTAALYRAGLTSSPLSQSREDGLRYRGIYLTAAVRCAPPGNMPLPEEFDHCRPYLVAELRALRTVRVIVALGAIAHAAVLKAAADSGWTVPAPRPAFAHGAACTLHRLDGVVVMLLDTYHPSRQNTQTRRLTPAMLDRVLRRAVATAGLAQ
ncbi:MAG: uracil-DNA glycosylase [Armatimonadota bacterium]|nr:uracil-DNA glycosylase [Armatimonadota bacterium]MDR7455371.1 uracil-DNA glycosylase [Armatimonadota bacterium]MDR7496553.1 uracil-DNA glycosylase [Armatimonadota bacterium]MDR7512595.1 uracil-DNA glycosylase [Armatimonadota bacterium]